MPSESYILRDYELMECTDAIVKKINKLAERVMEYNHWMDTILWLLFSELRSFSFNIFELNCSFYDRFRL